MCGINRVYVEKKFTVVMMEEMTLHNWNEKNGKKND